MTSTLYSTGMEKAIKAHEEAAYQAKKREIVRRFRRDENLIIGPWTDDVLEDIPDAEKVVLPPDQQANIARRVVRRAFADEEWDLEETEPQRVLVVWRMIRFLGQVLRLPAAEDSFERLVLSHDPYSPVKPGPLDNPYAFDPRAIEIYTSWKEQPRAFWDLQVADIRVLRDVMGLTYPMARRGLFGLLDQDMLSQAMPSPYDVIAFERSMIERVLNLISIEGIVFTRNNLRGQYRLNDTEIKLLTDHARAMAVKQTEASEEERRALMQIRLESLARNLGHDPRAQLTAAKTLAVVQGLTKGSSDQDGFADLVDAINEVVEETNDQYLLELEDDD